jgi:hypothetical protein
LSHSIFAPSSSHRWLNCSGCIKLSEKCPPQESSPAAELGSHAHALAEMCFETGLSAYHFVGKETASGFTVTKQVAQHVQTFLDYVNSYVFDLKAHRFIETRVNLSYIDPRLFGTADSIVISNHSDDVTLVHIFDLKYGLYKVDVNLNPQLMYYALGVLDNYKALLTGHVGGVTAHICQPRVGPPESCFYPLEMLAEFEADVRRAVKEADEAPTYHEGDWCKWCPAEFVCPELNKLGRKVF